MMRNRLWWWTRRWCPTLVAALSLTLLAVSISIYIWGDRPSLRPILASEDMPRDQAMEVAESTARLWAQEVRAEHRANVGALTCRESGPGTVAGDRLARVGKFGTPIEILNTGDFIRATPDKWQLTVFFFWPGFGDNGKVFEFLIEEGELRLCDIVDPPTLA